MTIVTTPLANKADVIRGVSFAKGDAVSEPRDGFIPVLRAGNIQDDLILSSDLVFVPEQMVSEKQRLRRGDIVMCTSSGSAEVVGKTAFAYSDWRGSFGAFCAVVRPKAGKCSPRYLFHYLQSSGFREWTRNSSGAGIKNIRKSELDEVGIPFPNLNDQHRIAAILDKADSISRKRQQALTLADDFVSSTYRELFENGSWPIRTLAEVVAEGTIVTYGIVQAGPEVLDGVPYIRTGDIKNGEIRPEGLRHTSQEIASKFARSRVKAGEIIMSIRATVGTTAVVPSELDGANLTQGTARIAPGKDVTLEYLISYLRSAAAQEWIQSQVKGATFREITLARLRELPVLVPPLPMQKHFSGIYAKSRQVISRLKMDAASASELCSSLSQRAFRGEL